MGLLKKNNQCCRKDKDKPSNYEQEGIKISHRQWLVAVWSVALLILIVAASSFAVSNKINPKEANSQFAQGKRLLQKGDWKDAATVFEHLAGQYPQSKDLDKFVFYHAKAKYYLGEFSEAIAGFSHFLTKYPNSPQYAHTCFFLANAYYRKGDINHALDQYLVAYSKSRDSRLDRLLLKSLTALFRNAGVISIDERKFDLLPSGKKCRLAKPLIPILLSHDQVTIAETLIDECGEKLDSIQYQSEMDIRKDMLKIAMLLPLSGNLQTYGEEIYNGSVIAAEMLRMETGQDVQLVPYDTKGYPIDAARIMGELNKSSVTAVVGPLTSESAAVTSARMCHSGVPLLIPAATQAGLTLLSESSFQLSPNIELEGVRMAEYAISVLGADSAVLISSPKSEHLHSSRAFVRRFKELGGTIVAIEHYRFRDKDFGPYIRDIKAVLLGAIPDSAFYVNSRGDTIDVDGLPAHVDCLFLPGDKKQIRLLLPQIHFYNLTGAYLGSDQWGDEVIYKLDDDITKQAVFPSPFLKRDISESFLQFSKAYRSHYDKPPERLASLGYDAMTLIGRAFSKGAKTPQALTENLKAVRGYSGASGIITFGDKRENVEMPLYRILAGEAVSLEKEQTEEIIPSE
ncbi:MAG: penicillin-binding protein activator [candidate division Zixibacteria bacterium]|nr:penicillin-binding protein activator [candidate division Zixibacteria bacterium]